MPALTTSFNLPELGVLLRGHSEPIADWTTRWSAGRLGLHLGAIICGAGVYGATMGWWRDPLQALFVAIKLPLVVLLTTGANALLNAMLAPLLGLNVPFRQSFQAILMSFTITASVLASFSPLTAFLTWNVPPLASAAASRTTHSLILLAHVSVIAFAGVVGNVRLFQLLLRLGGSRRVALRVLFAWLAGNLFLGSQLSWILRPFFGSPGLPVEFLRETAFEGNFYESVWRAIHLVFRLN